MRGEHAGVVMPVTPRRRNQRGEPVEQLERGEGEFGLAGGQGLVQAVADWLVGPIPVEPFTGEGRSGAVAQQPLEAGAVLGLDTHAVQGHGEVSGTALESPMRIVYEISVIKGGRSIAEPQYETDEYYATTGFATTIDEAAKKATQYMIDYLVETKGLSREQAYMLASLAGDLKITETVYVPHMLVTMHMPKYIFTAPGPNR
jgi:hypothetical protein